MKKLHKRLRVKARQNLRRYSRRHRKNKNSFIGLTDFLLDSLKGTAKAIISKIIITTLTFILVGIIYDRFIENPSQKVLLVVCVNDFYSPDRQLKNIPIHIEGYRDEYRTDSSGCLSALITVRKNDEALRVTCGAFPFRSETKDVDIPIHVEIGVQTFFSLESIAKPDDLYTKD